MYIYTNIVYENKEYKKDYIISMTILHEHLLVYLNYHFVHL